MPVVPYDLWDAKLIKAVSDEHSGQVILPLYY